VCDAGPSGVVFVMIGSMLLKSDVESRDDEMATTKLRHHKLTLELLHAAA
jgi:hypothetical protein